MSSDIIMEGDFIHAMLDSHRAKDAAITVLVKEQPEEDPQAAAAGAPVKKPKRSNFDFVGLTDQRRLLFLSSTEDFEETFRLKRSMLRKFPNMTLNTTLSDPHLYVFSRWTLDLLEKRNEEKKCTSLKHDFLPYLLKCQHEPHLYQGAFSFSERTPTDRRYHFFANYHATPSITPLHTKYTDIEIPVKTGLELTMSSTPADIADKVYCQAFLIDSKVFCMRANTMDGFLEANRDVRLLTLPGALTVSVHLS
jgi:translation initiation factor eIF-2B subunit gamma